MIYKHFSLKLIVRFLFILLNMIAISIFIIHAEKLFTSLVLVIILVVQITEILKSISKTNREIERFVQSLKYEETGIRFVSTKKRNELFESFNEILEFIEKIKLEKEAQFHFIDVVLKKANVGIIALSDNGNIEIINDAAKQILNLFQSKNWNHIKNQQAEFAKVSERLKPGEKELLEIMSENEKVNLSITVSLLKVMDRKLRVIVFQNIKYEIEQSEVESWNKLIRTIAHEIMNSVTPISSLTETSLLLLEKNHTTEKINKVQLALKTIEKRSNGLLDFVDEVRNLVKLPEPHLEEQNAYALVDGVYQLYKSLMDERNIQFHIEAYNKDMLIKADQKLIEQTLINLIKNSIEALPGIDNSHIKVNIIESGNKTTISVSDNGIGISEENLNRIFTPFYTTKDSGSGIGLSFSRQIMLLHKGSISATSQPGIKTVFTLSFYS